MRKILIMACLTVLIRSLIYCVGPPLVNLGTAENYVILATTGVSTTGTTSIIGNIGLSPAAATYITGFGLIMDPSGIFSTSSLVTGHIYASNYTNPTPSNLTTAISNMQTAYTDAAGRSNPDFTELYAGDLTGQTLIPGLYKWSSAVLISAAGVTIAGGANDVWIFQIAQDLTIADGCIITLSGGAQAKNIFWQIAGQAVLGTTSQFKGIILCQTLISMNTGATVNGRLLAQTAVTLDQNTVVQSNSITAITDSELPIQENDLVLEKNYPNPFNPSTSISFYLNDKAAVKLSVYNTKGQLIKTLVNESLNSGQHSIVWNGTDLNNMAVASGIYFYNLQSKDFSSSKKMILIK